MKKIFAVMFAIVSFATVSFAEDWDSEAALNRVNTIGTKILGNTLIHNASLQASYQQVYIQGTNTDLQVANNSTDQPLKFVQSVDRITSKFTNNDAIYSLSETYSGGAGYEVSGTFPANLTNFSELLVSVGETTNSQMLEFKPWLNSGPKFDGTRTYKACVPKNDGTYGLAVLECSNAGADWSYTGDVALRHIWAKD